MSAKLKTKPNHAGNYGLSFTALCALFAISQSSLAQEVETVDQNRHRAGGAALLEEVMVTARKKSDLEAAQSVPIAITAFSGEQIESTFSLDIRDIGMMVPNAQLKESQTVPGTATLLIRGMGTTSSIPSLDPSVGLIKDGLFYGQRLGAYLDTFDLESIEVLRGPQGTLFGRNVTGGAVVVKSRRPSLQPGVSGRVAAIVGTDAMFNWNVYTDLTMIDDVLGANFSVSQRESDGTVENINPIGGTLGDIEVLNLRGAIKYQPTEAIDLSFIVERYENGSDTTVTGDPEQPDFFKQDHDIDNQVDQEIDTYIGELNWDLGHGVVTAIAGYRDTDAGDNGPTDLDGRGVRIFHFRSELYHEQTSAELRYATQGSENFDLTVGAFFLDQDLTYNEVRFQTRDRVRAGSGTVESETAAIFAQGDIRFSDQWTLTLGGRYTVEDKSIVVAPLRTCAVDIETQSYDFNDCDFYPEQDDDWSNFSPKATLTYSIDDDRLVYATYARGFRSGGYNVRYADRTVPPASFDEEVVDSFELGLKSEWNDGRLRLNAAIFHNEFDDLQRSVTNDQAIQDIFNAAEATMSGAELEVTALLFEEGFLGGSLLFTGNIGYVDASYDFYDTDGDGISDSEDLDFNKVSPWTGAASLIYDAPLADWGDVSARVAYSYEDEAAADDANNNVLPAIEEVNASISFINASGRLRVSLFGRNLTDQETLNSWLNAFDAPYLRQGRRVGVEVSYAFGD